MQLLQITVLYYTFIIFHNQFYGKVEKSYITTYYLGKIKHAHCCAKIIVVVY